MSQEPTTTTELISRRNYVKAEIERRDAAIAAAEMDIGGAIADAHHKGNMPPLQGADLHLVAISGAVARISDLRQQLMELEQGLAVRAATRTEMSNARTHCPSCRAPRTSGERFCAVCGHHFLGEQGDPGTACDRCGEGLQRGAFCPRCGWRVALSTLGWWRARWVRLFLGGLLLYIFAQAILPTTHYNAGFIAAELVIGSTLVPLTFVMYFYERGTLRQTPVDVLSITFVLGAVLGCAAAAILEGQVHWHGNWQYLPVGFIEEAAKGVIVVWWLRRRDLLGADKGFVIGAATGMGFAVLETMGTYALNDFIQSLLGNSHTAPLTAMVSDLNVRGALAPLGHGTWTGILAGVMWYERSVGRSPFGKRVLLTYVAVSLLHTLYDISVSSHVLLISFVSGSKVALPGLVFGLIGLASLLVMVRLVRRGEDPLSKFVERANRVQSAVSSATRI